MIELVKSYYASERQTALIGIGIGFALTVIALVLWRGSPMPSLARGMGNALVVAGLVFAATSAGYIVVVGGRAAATIAAYTNLPDRTVAEREVYRMHEVKRAGVRPLAIHTAVLIMGIGLLFASAGAPTRKGVALALMITGVLGHSIEAFSMQKNQRYADEIATWPAAR